MLSMRMIKLYGNSVCKTMPTIFNDCLNVGKYPLEWKKAKIVSVDMKEHKQCKKV